MVLTCINPWYEPLVSWLTVHHGLLLDSVNSDGLITPAEPNPFHLAGQRMSKTPAFFSSGSWAKSPPLDKVHANRYTSRVIGVHASQPSAWNFSGRGRPESTKRNQRPENTETRAPPTNRAKPSHKANGRPPGEPQPEGLTGTF